MTDLSAFLRDFHASASIEIDIGLIDFLASVMDTIGAQSATVLSAYRTPETNAKLARTTFGVAENSQHLFGRALDVSFESKLTEAMLAARAMQRGGVGWYPHSGFLHIDTGPVRNWDLDESALQSLLSHNGRVRSKVESETNPRDNYLLPRMERSGRFLPEITSRGHLLTTVEKQSRLLTEMTRR